jgi:hypothetical protein
MISYPPEVLQAIIADQDTFVWEAPSFPKYQRGKNWYFFMTLAAVFLVAYSIWTSNFLFAFIVLLSCILLILTGTERPEAVLVQIGDHGVVWDGKLYPYQEIDQFAIVYQPPTKVLYLNLKSTLQSQIRVPLEEQDPVAVRSFLKQFVYEDLDLQDENLSDILGRLLRI